MKILKLRLILGKKYVKIIVKKRERENFYF